MRLYIGNIAKRAEELKPDLIDFVKSIENARYWTRREAAERDRHDFAYEGGITMERPFGGGIVSCTDFQVEQRPQGCCFDRYLA